MCESADGTYRKKACRETLAAQIDKKPQAGEDSPVPPFLRHINFLYVCYKRVKVSAITVEDGYRDF